MTKPRHYRLTGPAPAKPPARRALPARFRRPTLLVVGCGDVGLRLLRQLAASPRRWRVLATTRRADQAAAIRAAGARPLAADLDDARSLGRLAAFGRWTVNLAPPPASGTDDPRSRRLLAALNQPAWRRDGSPPARWVYVSTTGVYGDCGGAVFDETRPVAPANPRAVRRVAAERRWRTASRHGRRLTVLRVPGIYAGDRLPIDRLKAGLPALRDEDDVHTNHIHAEDLARACLAALLRGAPNRLVHAVDDSDLKMGDYFDQVADALGLPRPPRLPRAEVAARVSPAMLSFMSESRRLANRRLRRELAVVLRFPTVASTIAQGLLD